MRPWALALAVLAGLPAAMARAHDFWIEPSTFQPAADSEVALALRVGQRLQGEPVPRIPGLVERFFLRDGAAEHPVEGAPGAEPAGSVRIAAAGRQWAAYQSHPSAVTLEPGRFEDYLREEGLEEIVAARARLGQAATPGRERYHRSAKALLHATGPAGGKRAEASIDAPLGLTLEIVPRRDPTALPPEAKLPLQLLFRGQPAAGRLVVAMNRAHPERLVSVRTDRDGQALLPLAGAGFWLVKSVAMVAAPPGVGVDWESWWASLTFELPGGRGQ
jgi:hypothetical protein